MAQLVVSAAQDASIDAADTDNHRGSLAQLFVKGSLPRRILINFDASALPEGATITAATLRLFREGQFGIDPTGRTYLVDRLTTAWVEAADSNPGTDGATWSHADIPTTAWTTAGGDFVTTDEASALVAANGQWTEWDVTALVANRPDDMLRWLIQDSLTTGNHQTVFASREAISNQPQLVIDYDLGGEAHSGGSTATVNATTEGAGQKAGSDGNTPTLLSAPEGAGVKHAIGSATSSVVATADGAGTTTRSSGSTANLTVDASGAGSKKAQAGSAALIPVTSEGGGSKATSGGVTATITVITQGGGSNSETGWWTRDPVAVGKAPVAVTKSPVGFTRKPGSSSW